MKKFISIFLFALAGTVFCEEANYFETTEKLDIVFPEDIKEENKNEFAEKVFKIAEDKLTLDIVYTSLEVKVNEASKAFFEGYPDKTGRQILEGNMTLERDLKNFALFVTFKHKDKSMSSYYGYDLARTIAFFTRDIDLKLKQDYHTFQLKMLSIINEVYKIKADIAKAETNEDTEKLEELKKTLQIKMKPTMPQQEVAAFRNIDAMFRKSPVILTERH